MMRGIFIILALMLAPLCWAQTPPNDALTFEQIEVRARNVGRALRCVVCQNQSIDESDAPLAADMRKIVRARLASGETEAQVMDYMRQSYGDYVLLKPPIQANTAVLWGLPFLILLIGLFWFFKPAKTAQSKTPHNNGTAS
ncbi:MAG: cytochrome c-type biogenesis protein [Litorimonas sp.]